MSTREFPGLRKLADQAVIDDIANLKTDWWSNQVKLLGRGDPAPISIDDIVAAMDRLWREYAKQPPVPDMIIVANNDRTCRRTRRWRGKLFVTKISFIEAYRLALRGEW